MPSVGKLGKAFGEYRAAVVRTQLHSESIAALKGAAVEKHIITQMFDQMMAVQVLPHGHLCPTVLSLGC